MVTKRLMENKLFKKGCQVISIFFIFFSISLLKVKTISKLRRGLIVNNNDELNRVVLYTEIGKKLVLL